ncbi:MAG TPA: hypothetical protein VIQ29_25335 [Ancylobacter sp.]
METKVARADYRILALAVCVALVGRFLVNLNYFALPFPQQDDFSNIVSWANALFTVDRKDVFKALTRLEAEHLQVFGRTIYLAVLWLNGTLNLRYIIIIGGLFWVGVAAVLGFYCLRAFEDVRVRCLTVVLVTASLLHLQTYDSLAFASGAANNLTYPLLLLAGILMSQARSLGWFLASLFVGWLCFYTLAPGLFSLFGIIAVQILKRSTARAIAAVMFTLLACAVYVLSRDWSAVPAAGAHFSLTGAIHYVVLFIGSAAGNINIRAGLVLGAILIAFWSVIAVLAAGSREFRSSLPPFPVGTALACFGVAGSAGLSRSLMGPAQAVSSRYAAISIILVIVTVLLVVSLLPPRWRLAFAACCTAIAILFNLATYPLYSPVLEAVRSTNLWNAKSFFAGRDDPSVLIPPEISRNPRRDLETAFDLGLINRAILKSSMESRAIVTGPVSLTDRNPRGNSAVGYLDFLSRLPDSVKLQGWVAIPKTDLLAADTQLILDGEQASYTVPTLKIFRPDVAQAESQLVWCGFVAYIDPRIMPPGKYAVSARIRVGSRVEERNLGVVAEFPEK